MTRQLKELDFIINKNGTIARIMEFCEFEYNKVKLRKVNLCTGAYSNNVGTHYTHQSITTIDALKKNWTLIGTEKILTILCRVYKK